MKDKVYNYLKQYFIENGYAPTVREIGTAVGLKSTSSVVEYLNKLDEEGLINRNASKSRAIEIPELDTVSANSTVNIPVVGQIAAGEPIFAEQNITDYIPIATDFLGSGEYFMLVVKGDSMIEKGIFNRDYVLVKKQNYADNGQIVAALLDDSATVKTFYKEKDGIRLQPENSALSPIFTRDVEILGIVKGVFRRL